MDSSVSRWRSASLAIAVVVGGCGKVNATMSDAAASSTDAAVFDATADAPVPNEISVAAGAVVAPLGTGVGDPFMDHCAAGQALTGYYGATGATGGGLPVVGRIVGQCGIVTIGPPSGNGYSVVPVTGVELTPRGANTTKPWTSTCKNNQFAVGFAIQSGTALDQLSLECAPLTLVRQDPDAEWTLQIGEITRTEQVGGSGGLPREAPCPPGQVVTASDPLVVAAAGATLAYLGNIGFECSAVTAH